MTNSNVKQNSTTEESFLQFTIEGKPYKSQSQYLSGLKLKEIASLPKEVELFLSVQAPWKDELIGNEDKVDLARPEIEHFYVKRQLSYLINGKHFESDRQYIKGKQIRAEGNIPAMDEIFLSIAGPWDDELIKDEDFVDLARPGTEHFYSKEVLAEVTLIVNARDKKWCEKAISYTQVVILAFGKYDEDSRKVYTVTYKKGPKENPEGSMVLGDTVIVKNKMIFNVTPTDKS